VIADTDVNFVVELIIYLYPKDVFVLPHKSQLLIHKELHFESQFKVFTITVFVLLLKKKQSQ